VKRSWLVPLLSLALVAPQQPQVHTEPAPAQPKCARIIIGPPGTKWFVRNDTLMVLLAPPLSHGWFCPKGVTPPTQRETVSPAVRAS
jgi:hypothetical protein